MLQRLGDLYALLALGCTTFMWFLFFAFSPQRTRKQQLIIGPALMAVTYCVLLAADVSLMWRLMLTAVGGFFGCYVILLVLPSVAMDLVAKPQPPTTSAQPSGEETARHSHWKGHDIKNRS